MSNKYHCRKCQTEDKSKFYPSIKSKCKACQKAVVAGGDRNPLTAANVKCLKCDKISMNPKQDFSISKVTELYLDKCKMCKYGDLDYEDNITIVDENTDIYKQWTTWMLSLHLSKDSAVIVSHIARKISLT